MSKHKREVSKQIRAEKQRQLEPLHRRTSARQTAAQEEVKQASQHSHTQPANARSGSNNSILKSLS